MGASLEKKLVERSYREQESPEWMRRMGDGCESFLSLG
jgi:hypothetical protein